MATTKRAGLGRGIGALIPTAPAEGRPVDVFFPSKIESDTGSLVEVPGARLTAIDPHSVVPNPKQPRTEFDADALAELVTSIREVGVLQPIVVRTIPGEPDKYELIMGERRLRASREVGLTTIPAIVRDTADENMLRDALLENLHRSELNPLEEASAYQQLLDDFGITQDQLAERIGRSRPQITNTLRLLRLPVTIQRRVAAGVLSAGHARAILSLNDDEAMEALAQRIVNEELSVRAVEAIVARGQEKRQTRPTVTKRNADFDEIADRLGDRFDTRVRISMGARRGKLEISFATVDDLNRILRELGDE